MVAIERDPLAAGFGEHAEAVGALLREPLADELTRGEAMRFAALLHDAAKPQTPRTPPGRAHRLPRPRPRGGRDRARRAAPPAGLGEARRPRRRALPAPPAARLPRPRAPAGPPRGLALPAGDRAVRRRRSRSSPSPTGSPRAAATPSRRSPPTSSWRASCSARRSRAGRRAGRSRSCAATSSPASSGCTPGPRLGELLAQLEEDRFAGAITTREDAIARARELAGGG